MTDLEHHFSEGDLRLICRYVVHSKVRAYEALGWINRGDMPGHHAEYSVLMEWPLERGEPIEPSDSEARQ
jgi:hypothetical protein